MKRLFFNSFIFILTSLLSLSIATEGLLAQDPPELPENFQERLQELLQSNTPEGRELLQQAMQNGGRLELTPEQIERYFGEGTEENENNEVEDNSPELPEDGIPDGAIEMEIDPSTPEGRELLERLQSGGGLLGDPETIGKEAAEIRAEYRPVVAEVRSSTARILNGDDQLALATVISADGYLITKASEIAKATECVYCQFGDEDPVPAALVATDEAYDIALLKVEANDLTPVTWSDSDAPSPVGTFVASSGLDDDPIAIGAVSVEERNPAASERGYIGIAPQISSDGVFIQEVVENGPAAIAGLQVEDIITAVGDQAIETLDDLFEAVGDCSPGTEVSLSYVREGESQTVDIGIGSRSLSGERASAFNGMNALGGPLSDRASDFPLVLQHDSIVKPNECGGPLVNLDGEVIGINIARAGRVKTYAIPTHAVREVISQLRGEN